MVNVPDTESLQFWAGCCSLAFAVPALVFSTLTIRIGFRKMSIGTLLAGFLFGLAGLLVAIMLLSPVMRLRAFSFSPAEVVTLYITPTDDHPSKEAGEVAITDASQISAFFDTLSSASHAGSPAGVEYRNGFSVKVELVDESVVYYSCYRRTTQDADVYAVIPHVDSGERAIYTSNVGAYRCRETYEWISTQYTQCRQEAEPLD